MNSAKSVLQPFIRLFDFIFDVIFYSLWGGESAFRRKCLEFAAVDNNSKVLDICCGSGELIAGIEKPEFNGTLVGIDISGPDIKTGNTRFPYVAFVLGSSTHLPVRSSFFDSCFVSLGLHHLTKQERLKTLSEISRALAPDGALYIIDYNLPEKGPGRPVAEIFARLDKSGEAYTMLKSESLADEIRQAGMEIETREMKCKAIFQLLRVKKKEHSTG